MKMGLGMEINSSIPLSAQLELAKAGCSFAMSSSKADGYAPGINSPLTNPIKDLTINRNNVTLVNCAGTTSDGYDIINGMSYLKTDGSNTIGTIIVNSSTDILGTENFAISALFITAATLVDGFVVCKNDSSTATTQYAFRTSTTGEIILYLNGGSITVATAGSITTNTKYELLIIRESGVLKCYLNGVIKYNNANTTSITTRNYLRLFARSNSADGTISFGYSNLYHGAIAIFKGSKCTFSSVNKAMKLLHKGYV